MPGFELNILFFGDQWDDMWRRRQQLAWRLAQTELIEHLVYIENPLPLTSLVKFFGGYADRDGTDRWRRVLSNRSRIMPVGEKISILTPITSLPYSKPRLFLRKNFSFTKPIVYIGHPSVSVETIKKIEPGFVWYDCTEDFSAFPAKSNIVNDRLRVSDRWFSENANIITTVSRKLYDEKSQINPRTYSLPNAVDIDLFMLNEKDFQPPPELKDKKRPLLTFVGGLNDWAHDWELLLGVAAAKPNWNILLIGETGISKRIKEQISNHKNILCIGNKSYHELPSYLLHSDICFQFYRPLRGNDTRNSQKLFLYLAVGKPVISTRSADAESYTEFVRIADSAEEFISLAEEALKNDNQDLARRRRAMAKVNSWDKRVEDLTRIIKNEW
jgi:glycosyltransferase involved in cell wall biosynthesis